MIMEVVLKKLRSLLLFVVTIWKRAMCCFRRRRPSNDYVPLTQIGVVSDQSVQSGQDSWSDWNEQIAVVNSKPATVQEHIEFYRQQAIAARQAQDEDPKVQENFFDDMAPVITKQTKVLINNKNETGDNAHRLSLDAEGINVAGQELGEWDDHNGWEDQTLDWDAKEALKESRRQARLKKQWEQQQKRQEKFIRPALGARVPS